MGGGLVNPILGGGMEGGGTPNRLGGGLEKSGKTMVGPVLVKRGRPIP